MSPEQERRATADAVVLLDVLAEQIRGINGVPTTIVAIDTNDLEKAEVEFDARVIPLLVAQNLLRPNRE